MSVDAGPPHRRPRWVTVAAAVALVLLVVLVVLWLAGGSHGPGRHLSAPQAQGVVPATVEAGTAAG